MFITSLSKSCSDGTAQADPKVHLAQELPPPSPLGLYRGMAGVGGERVAKGPALWHKGTCPRSSQMAAVDQGPDNANCPPAPRDVLLGHRHGAGFALCNDKAAPSHDGRMSSSKGTRVPHPGHPCPPSVAVPWGAAEAEHPLGSSCSSSWEGRSPWLCVQRACDFQGSSF